jgi:hypothetical protein
MKYYNKISAWNFCFEFLIMNLLNQSFQRIIYYKYKLILTCMNSSEGVKFNVVLQVEYSMNFYSFLN